MNAVLKRSLVLALVLIGSMAATTHANPYSARQYYGSWQKHPKQSYYYRSYYYKPTPTYAGYKHQYVMYSPQKPDHYYYYNPYKKVYWGRCPINTNGKPLYSQLAEKDCKENLEDIPETAFPEPGKVPPLPEASDDATLDLPPDDLPNLEKTPK